MGEELVAAPMMILHGGGGGAEPGGVEHHQDPVAGFPCTRCHGLPTKADPQNANEIMELGLAVLGMTSGGGAVLGQENTTRMRRFQAHYGIHPKGLFEMFSDMKEEAHNNPTGVVHCVHFLMTINWMKCYETEHCMHSRWGLSEQTIREKIRMYIAKINALKQRVVSNWWRSAKRSTVTRVFSSTTIIGFFLLLQIVWGNFDNDDVYIISVDGVHCQIWEPRKDPGAQHYSHKSNSAGKAYEIGIAIRRRNAPGDFCVWIRGPFDASTHDLTIFRGGKKGNNDEWDQDSLYFAIPAGKKAIADSGYVGEADLGGKVAVTRDTDSEELKRFKGRAKARHETFNKHLKDFVVLDVPFRQQNLSHGAVFEAVCIVVQYDLLNGYPLFDV